MDTTMLAKKILQITRHGYYEEQVKKIAQLLDSITSASNDGKPLVSGSLPSDEDIEKYFSWGYGGDAGSAIFGAKWLKKEILLGGNDR